MLVTVTTASKIIPVVNEAVSFLGISLCHFLCCSALPRGMKHVLRMTSDSVSSSSSCHYYFLLAFYKAFSAFLILWIVDFNSLSRHDFLRWLSLVVASSGHSFLLFLPGPGSSSVSAGIFFCILFRIHDWLRLSCS